MKKLQYLLLIATMLTACSQDVIVEVQNPTTNLNRTISVSFEEEDTRIQLNDELKTVWTKDDLVSVFYRSTVNEQWQFQGETGDRSGNITPTDSSINPPATTNHIVVVYPYNENYFYNSETHNIQASLPAEQTYIKNSYGLNGNILISSSEYNQISLKSVCGWLKLKLTGSGEKVQSIALRGNNDEQVAGELYINTADATSTLASASNNDVMDDEVGGTLVRPGTILKEVTLNCGDGVELGTEPTAFYIALPPQTFEKGITVEITCSDGTKMIKSSNKVITIVRNHILPMTEVVYSSNIPPSNQIWYTSSNSNTIQPYNTNIFGANIISNTYDSKGVITFDGDVTMIGKQAFRNCDKLTGITLSESVTSIGENAFYDCDGLTSITIPDSVTMIGDSAFYMCSSLTGIIIPDSVITIGDHALRDCDSLTSVTIPDNVTTIGRYAFSECRILTSVTIGDRVTTIGDYAFNYCTNLTNVTIPNSVTKIGEWAFGRCKSLSSVTIPNSVTAIGSSSFYECHNLISVTIGDSVKSIGSCAFDYCYSLISVYCKAITPPTLDGNHVFDLNDSSRIIYVPASEDDSIINAYKAATGWKEYKAYIYEYDYTNE